MKGDDPTNSGDPDYDFRHHLYDTLVLLGCEVSVASMLKKSLDGHIQFDHVDALRNYNIYLMTGVKTRLASVNTIKVRLKGEDE